MNTNDIMTTLVAPKTGKHLGDMVSWGKLAELPIEVVTEKAAALNFSEFAPTRITYNGAYRRAVSRVLGRSTLGERTYNVVKVSDDDDYITHEILATDVVDAGADSVAISDRKASFAHEVFIRFDKRAYEAGGAARGLVEAENMSHPLVQTIVETYDHLCTHFLADDIRAGFQAAFKTWAGINMIESGGMFLVPAAFAGRVRVWREFMGQLNLRTKCFEIFDTEGALTDLKAAADDALEAQLARLIADVDGFASGDKTRVSTLEARVGEFDELRDRAAVYEMMLSTSLTDIRGRMDQAQAALMQAIEAAYKAKEERRAARAD